MTNEQFEQAKQLIIGKVREKQGIGTLAEKTVHAVLKHAYAPDADMHEIPIENFVADIYTGTEIIEIQTRQFNKMRKKLETFLALYPVTIVYPIPHKKWLIWVDEETGELSEKRKSPLTGNEYMGFIELYKIKPFLTDENLRIRFVLIDMDEYKLLNGYGKDKKKRATRFDRIPLLLEREVVIEQKEDYMQFVPYDLPDEFSVKDFAKAAKIQAKLAGTVVHILHHVGILSKTGKKGNSFLYRVNDI